MRCDRAVVHEFVDQVSVTAVYEAHREGIPSNLGATYWREELPGTFGEVMANRPVLVRANKPARESDEDLARILKDERTSVSYGVPVGGATPTHVMTVSFSDGAAEPTESELAWVRRAARVVEAALLTIDRDRRSSQEERDNVRRQRLEAIGLLAGSVAHDFNNLLQAFSGIADLLMLEDLPRTEQLEHFRQLRSLSKTGAELVGSLLVFSRHDKVQRRPVDLDAVLKRFVRTIRPLTPSNIEVRTEIDEHLGTVLTVGSDVEQALLNVYNNAVAAMPNGGRLVLSARRIARGESNSERVRIRFSDSGTGMSQSVLERATEPFFTTKGAGEGTGLGLAMVQAHMQQCNGALELISAEGEGTTIVFDYPGFDGVGEVESLDDYDVGGTETIVVVEDEAVIRRVTRSMLAAAGYQVITAAHGEEALDLLQRHADGARADLLITDAVMPKMGGRALYESLVGEGKNLPVIVCSGYSRGTLDPEFFASPERAFLQKPFTRSQLLAAVRNLLDQPSR